MKVTEVATDKQFYVSMMVAGDFNCVLSHTKRLGGKSLDAEIDEFQSCVDVCGLVYSPAKGAFYTWNNKQDASTRVFSRLDRFQGTKMFKVVRKLKLLKNHLRQFNKDHFADIERNTMMALKHLEAIQIKIAEDPSNEYWLNMEKQAVEEYNTLQGACTLFFSQKAKLAWNKEGDNNTKYFHGVIRSTVIKNQVVSVKDVRGQGHSDPQAVKDAFLEYYKDLLGTAIQTDKVNTQIIRRERVCVAVHQDVLLLPVSKEEVKDAIFFIPEHKTPGPDGYSSAFFKDSWSIIGDEICDAIQDFFRTGKLLKQLNATTITLILKCKMTTHVYQFRPIVCCNVFYKCISKILCNRLAVVLPELVSMNQGGFLKGRSIIENIMVCQDLVRMYNRQASSARCMFKMDLMKAYDSVSWEKETEARDPMSPRLVTLCLKKDILLFSGFKEGSLPFKYLGVPITAGRFKNIDCGVLIDKTVERIRSLGDKKHSFAGRLVLVIAVLSTMYSYRASMFVLTKGVMNRVDAIYRNYLWEGSTDNNKAPLIAWHKVCVPKKEGSLGLRLSSVWNVATIRKLAWWLSVKPDKLWVQWVYHVYLKVCQIRDIIKEGFIDGNCSIGVGGYSVNGCQALMLKEKLFRFQVTTDDACCICALATKSHLHLFQDCIYSQKIYSTLAVKLGTDMGTTNQLTNNQKKKVEQAGEAGDYCCTVGCLVLDIESEK
ncbi:uncharacterized protein LOC141641476 [Silene latifolia]|uniref:uncharacterized protein LOC141641476 n=1 Tax=Silene latifolia TaxID=37657 RepID=UPI003D7716B6